MKVERTPTFAEYLEFWLATVMRHLPVAWVSTIGGFLGARVGRRGIARGRLWVDRLHRNFERYCGVSDPGERERRIIEYTRSAGRVYAEFTVLQRIVSEGRVEIIGLEHLEHLSRPAILACCHLANWELAGYVLSLLEGRVCALYAPPENPMHNRLAFLARNDWPRNRKPELVSAASPHAMRQINRAMASGSNLLMYVDEERDEFIWAPSLGRELPYAGNRWLTARLAVRHKSDIVPVHVEVLGPARYRVVIEPKLDPGSGSADTRSRTLADQMDRCFEKWIKAHPEHWHWLHLFEPDKPLPGVVKGE